ncbi:MAG: formimidoylglutamate deiminase [Hyphomonadaceae bacterium]|nr:formimidoylglutamate deiminase [Hyphomonadaceae bacterium]
MATIWFKQALLPAGWAEDVRISFSARIEAVELGVAPQPQDDRRAIGAPGLANVHSHGFQRALLAETRGPAGDNFWTWRVEMYRFLDRLTPEDVAAITAQAYCDMLQGGFTRVGEFHYLHHDPSGAPYADLGIMAKAVAHAAEEAGIGLTLLPVLYAHADFGGAPPLPGQRRFICDLDSFGRLVDASGAALPAGANLGVAPHSLRAVTPQELAFAASLAPNGPIHIHAAEQVREVEACQAWSGMRPVEWLLANAEVDQRWTLIHATHVNASETAALARSGAQAGLCPVTEANLGDGIFPTPDYLAQAGAFGVGTDSNIAIDAAAELRMLEYAQRLTRRARNVLAPSEGASTGAALFRAACAGGARSLGVETGLAPGAPADFFSFNAEHPSLAGRTRDELLDAWVFSAGAGAIDAVWAMGEKRVEGGRHVKAEAIARDFAKTVRKLRA